MADAVSLIKVVMVVGFFQGNQLVSSYSWPTTFETCEAAWVYAQKANFKPTWFWEEETEDWVSVACVPHPSDLEV